MRQLTLPFLPYAALQEKGTAPDTILEPLLPQEDEERSSSVPNHSSILKQYF